jgi:uncharacterized protein DUF1570
MTRLGSVCVAALLALLALLASVPARAQQDEDPDLEDQRKRDEQYLERYRQREAAPVPTDPAQAAQQFLAKADELIRDKNHRSTVSARYRIQTDDPRLDLDAVASLLESFATFFGGLWPGEPQQPTEPVRVFLFYSYHKYNQLLEADFSRQVVRPAGHYGSAFGALVIHSDPGGSTPLADTLVHEATHQLLDRRVYGSGATRPSIWITEGLASVFEHTLMSEGGKFEAGTVGGKSIALVRGSRPDSKSDARPRLAAVRKALEDPETTLALDVVAADEPEEFYGPGALERYDQAWVLVHYLLYGDSGRYREGFLRYLAADATGHGDAATLERECGIDLRALDPALAAHVKSISVK